MASANVGDCLSGAWGTFKKNVLTHVVCTLLVMVVAGVSAGLLAGPMVVGYMRMIERESRGELVQIGDVFRGFDDFVPAFVAGLISSLVVSLGFMLCFIPGLLVMALPPGGKGPRALRCIECDPLSDEKTMGWMEGELGRTSDPDV